MNIAPIRARPNWTVVSIAFASFVVFGIQSALLGIGWNGADTAEYVRGTFRLDLDAVGALLVAGTDSSKFAFAQLDKVPAIDSASKANAPATPDWSMVGKGR